MTGPFLYHARRAQADYLRHDRLCVSEPRIYSYDPLTTLRSTYICCCARPSIHHHTAGCVPLRSVPGLQKKPTAAASTTCAQANINEAAADVMYHSLVHYMVQPQHYNSLDPLQSRHVHMDCSQVLKKRGTRMYMQRSLLQADLRIIHGLIPLCCKSQCLKVLLLATYGVCPVHKMQARADLLPTLMNTSLKPFVINGSACSSHALLSVHGHYPLLEQLMTPQLPGEVGLLNLGSHPCSGWSPRCPNQSRQCPHPGDEALQAAQSAR